MEIDYELVCPKCGGKEGLQIDNRSHDHYVLRTGEVRRHWLKKEMIWCLHCRTAMKLKAKQPQ